MAERPDSGSKAGRTVRALMRAARTAALSTALAGEAGRPYASLVLSATAADGSPLLLISALAEHTKNLKADARLALLYEASAGLASPLEGARASVLGRLAPATEPADRARFLTRHPEAEAYASFRDFAFHRVIVDRAHLVAGFGRIHWVEAPDVLIAAPTALAREEESILAHMNADHADAVALYATALLGQPAGPWRMCGIDAEGCDLASDGRHARLPFPEPIADAAGAQAALVRLAHEARAKS